MKKKLVGLLQKHWGKLSLVAGLAYVWLADPLGCDEIGKVYHLEGRDIDDPSLSQVCRRLSELCPKNATDIKVDIHNGEILGGASCLLKCHVPKDDMRAFTKSFASGWRYDSTIVNVETNDVSLGMWSPCGCDGKWRDEWERASRSESFWSYFRVFRNCGGWRIIYFVDTETMFYDWSSN